MMRSGSTGSNRSYRQVSSALPVALLVLALAVGCAGGNSAFELSPAGGVPLAGGGQLGGPSLDDYGECPEGVDPEVYRMLFSAFEEMIAGMPEGKSASGFPEGPSGYVRDLRVVPYDLGRANIEWTYVNRGDYDRNSRVNVSDITQIGYFYETYQGDPDWYQARLADGNGDGAVTIADLTTIGANYGNFVPWYAIYRSKDAMDYPPFNGGVPGDGAECIHEMYRVAYNNPNMGLGVSDWDEGWYYWVVPTDRENYGQVSNLAGGPYGEWPQAYDVDPPYGLPGSEVVIRGTGFRDFSEDSRLELNSLELEIVSWAEDEITAVIPEQARDGMIRVQVGDILFTDAPEFLVAEPPVIESCLPDNLEVLQPCEVTGANFRNHQGTGLLLIDGRAQPVAVWRDGSINVDFLNPVYTECEYAQLQVIASNGLASAPVLVPSELYFGDIAVEPRQGIPELPAFSPTEFEFTFELMDELQDYVVSITPDYGHNNKSTIDDYDAGKPGVQFFYSNFPPMNTYDMRRSLYQPMFEFTNETTGHVFSVLGPELRIYNPHFSVTKLNDICPVDFGRDDIPAPNEICYNEVDGTFLDFTYINGQPCVSSSLTEFTDDVGEPLPSFTRDPNAFLRGGSNPRPYVYRHNMFDGTDTHPTSVLSVTGEDFTDTPDYSDFKISMYVLEQKDYRGWDGNNGWTDTEVRFALPADRTVTHHRLYHGSYDYGSNDDGYFNVLLAPLVEPWSLEGKVFDLDDGIVRLEGTNFCWRQPEEYYTDLFPGIAGFGLLTIWEVPVTYTSPWTSEEVTTRELLVTPIAPTYHDFDTVHIQLGAMDPDGDGLVTVEIRSEDGTEAQIIEAELTGGTASFFIWSGVLDSGSPLEITNSGIFSESYEVMLVRSEEENQPPVAELVNTAENQDVPVSIELSAAGSIDPDGEIIDYQWDLDGNGVFNETKYYNEFEEDELRGSSTARLYCDDVGTYRFSVKVTDNRGATSIATIECEMVDVLVDLQLNVRITNPDELTEVADTTCRLYQGDPEGDGVVLNEFTIGSVFSPHFSTGIPTKSWNEWMRDLPIRDDYWVELVNPDVDFRRHSEKETMPLSDTYLQGPLLITPEDDRTVSCYGTVWR